MHPSIPPSLSDGNEGGIEDNQPSSFRFDPKSPPLTQCALLPSYAGILQLSSPFTSHQPRPEEEEEEEEKELQSPSISVL